MSRNLCAGAGCALVLSLSLACNGDSNTPTTPSAASPGAGNAAPDGSTLKVSAPAIVSPNGGERLDNRQPSLVLQRAAGRYVVADVSYEFEVTTEGGQSVYSRTVPGGLADGQGTVTHAMELELDRDTPYRWRARARVGEDVGPWSNPASGSPMFVTIKENRAPDPGPDDQCFDIAGRRRSFCLPLPDMSHIVNEVADQFPGALSNSCQDHGGSWEFMDRVVDRLREFDTRWGYNWKRGNVGDPSLDVVTYHWGGGQSEGSREIHAIDIIISHCGNPSPAWVNITDFAGSGGMWTGRGRF